MSKTHYVDNKKFFLALKAHRIEVRRAVRQKKPKPPIPDYVGECFLLIATRLSFKPNFCAYSYREDMVMEAVENCLQYLDDFDPEKSSNPFGYFTQVIYFAFIRRIQREKRQTYTKYKYLEKMLTDGTLAEMPREGDRTPVDAAMLSFDNVQDFIHRYDEYIDGRRRRANDRRKARQDAPTETRKRKDRG